MTICSYSVTFDLAVWLWPYVKVKNVNVIKCCLLYCTLVPGLMTVSIILCEIIPLVHFLWHLTFTCDLHRLSRPLSFQSSDGCSVDGIGTKYENCMFNRILDMDNFLRKLKWRHNDVITNLIFMKFKHRTTKGISKWHTEFYFARCHQIG